MSLDSKSFQAAAALKGEWGGSWMPLKPAGKGVWLNDGESFSSGSGTSDHSIQVCWNGVPQKYGDLAG